jgi:hypothetical protein
LPHVLSSVVAAAVHRLALFGERGLLVQVVAGAVKVGDVPGDDDTLRVHPRTLADAILRVDRRGTAARARTEVGTPLSLSGPRRLRELLAIRVRPGQSAEVRALARIRAGHEERHPGGLRAGDSGSDERGEGDGDDSRA